MNGYLIVGSVVLVLGVIGLIRLIKLRNREYTYEDVRHEVLPLAPGVTFKPWQPYRVDRSDSNPRKLRALLEAQLNENLRSLPADIEAIPNTTDVYIASKRGPEGKYNGHITIRLRDRRQTA